MRVVVTGARGRLGRALIAALEDAPYTGPLGPIAWSRPAFDLDAVTHDGVIRLLERDRPEVVIHAAAWTDVEGCAKDPALALRRNGEASGTLARACAELGVELVLVSTNEVFDGERTDGRPYAPDDATHPVNPYGASKLAAERQAAEAYGSSATGHARLAIVRTSWLYGPPGNDFPAKILAAARRAHAAGEPLRVVGDEVGCPTYAPDLAEAIAELVGEDALAPEGARIGVHHLVNAGPVSRADWAREVIRAARVGVTVVDVPASTWARASTAPRWAVLGPTPLPSGEPMRDWRAAFADSVPAMLRAARQAG